MRLTPFRPHRISLVYTAPEHRRHGHADGDAVDLRFG
jgi:predicted GNAT family acetyltransferase